MYTLVNLFIILYPYNWCVYAFYINRTCNTIIILLYGSGKCIMPGVQLSDGYQVRNDVIYYVHISSLYISYVHHLSFIWYAFIFSVIRHDTRSVVPTHTMFYAIVFSRYLYYNAWLRATVRPNPIASTRSDVPAACRDVPRYDKNNKLIVEHYYNIVI